MGRLYFWNYATDLQKLQGLLRCLVFEILQRCPELATHAKVKMLCAIEQSGLMWMSNSNNATTSLGRIQLALREIGEGWTLRLLTEILGGILSHNESKKFTIHIDGLDEYKAQNTQYHQDLVNALQKTSGFFLRQTMCFEQTMNYFNGRVP